MASTSPDKSNRAETTRDDGERYAKLTEKISAINLQKLLALAIINSSPLFLLSACGVQTEIAAANISPGITQQINVGQEQNPIGTKAIPAPEAQTTPISHPKLIIPDKIQTSNQEMSQQLEVRTLNGIEVYGLNQPLDLKQVTELNRLINISFEAQVTHDIQDNKVSVPQSKTEKLDFLYPNTRRLEYVVTEEVYASFEKRSQNGRDVTFPEWAQYNVSLLDDLLEHQDPATNLRALLARIVIIKSYKSFDPRLTSPGDLDRNGTGRFQTEDLDGIRVITSDPYQEKSSYSSFTALPNNRRILKDVGERHEIIHRTTDYVDEYVQNYENQGPKDPIPGLNLISLTDEGNSENGWFSYFLRWQEQNGYRGEQVTRDNNRNAVDVFGLHPARPYLSFTSDSQTYFPQSAKVYVANNRPGDPYGGVYGQKEFVPAGEHQLYNGEFSFPSTLFEPESGTNYPRTNWLVEFNFTNGQTGKLHIPAAVFNIAYWSGDTDLSKISINLTGGYFVGYGSQKYADESLEITERNSPKPPEGYVLLATGTFQNSPYRLYWYASFK